MLTKLPKGSTEQLYAYSYQPEKPFTANDGWKIYDPLQEYERMGVGVKSDSWRFTTINRDYTVRKEHRNVYRRETFFDSEIRAYRNSTPQRILVHWWYLPR